MIFPSVGAKWKLGSMEDQQQRELAVHGKCRRRRFLRSRRSHLVLVAMKMERPGPWSMNFSVTALRHSASGPRSVAHTMTSAAGCVRSHSWRPFALERERSDPLPFYPTPSKKSNPWSRSFGQPRIRFPNRVATEPPSWVSWPKARVV